MATELYDLSQQPLPLRLLRVQQMRDHASEPMLFEYVQELQLPRMSENERAASTERLLHARRRGL